MKTRSCYLHTIWSNSPKHFCALCANDLPLHPHQPNPICSYEELEASGSFAALERPASPTVTAPEDQPKLDAAIAAVGSDEPSAPQAARARSRSTSTNGGNQRPPDASVSSSSATVNGSAPSEGVTVDDSSSVAAKRASVNDDNAVEVGVDVDVDVEAEAMNVEPEERVAAEAEKWVGGVTVDRIRSLSSMYRSDEGSRSLHQQQQLPRSRAASSTAARQERAETGIQGEKELPPELVVAEDQEVGL